MVLILRDRVKHSFSSFSHHSRMFSNANLPELKFHLIVLFIYLFYFTSCPPARSQSRNHRHGDRPHAEPGAMIHMKPWGRKFPLSKVRMWHEMRYGSKPNGYLINVWPGWRAWAHLLRVSSNMHDLLATANFSRNKKSRGREALCRKAVNLNISREKQAPYLMHKTERTKTKKQRNVKGSHQALLDFV